MHVGELVVALLHGQGHNVLDTRLDDQDGARGPAHFDSIDDDDDVYRVDEELLDQVDPADADIEQANPVRQVLLREVLDHGNSEPVVTAQDISHSGHEHLHGLTIPAMGDTSLRKLRRSLDRFPRDRYPIKHASIQRKIAHELAVEGSLIEAEAALRSALEIYGAELPVERAHTLNALGSVLRDGGRPDEAAIVFQEALDLLGERATRGDLGMSHYNLGLVQAQLGLREAAIDSLRQAVAHLDSRATPAQSAAARRELGSALLVEGRPAAAIGELETAAHLAARGGDRVGLGAAANLLGLARLALGDGEGAVAAFAESASAHALTVRPEGHAMAKANAALAYEALGDSHRARQCAQQALSLPQAARAVIDQANAVLDRLGHLYHLHVVLDTEPQETWSGVLRDEVRHWVRCEEDKRGELIRDWVVGQLERPGTAVERCAALFDALLELPPEAFGTVTKQMRARLAAIDEAKADLFRSHAARAAARFRLPQMQRLERALRLV